MNAVKDKIKLLRGDITRLQVDAIVNAANSALMDGGGVNGAIHRAGGPEIPEACKEIIAKQGHCPEGGAVITTGGMLPAKYVIHTVGPVWKGGQYGEEEKLAACYTNSLKLALEKSILTIAFPNISTGIYGYPRKEAAVIAVNTVSEFLRSNHSSILVYFICFDEENFMLYQNLLK